MEHTKGPWTLETGDRTHRFVLVKDSDDRTIFYKYNSGSKVDGDLDEANAALTSAAPDLLECLREAREKMLGASPSMKALIRKADAAIAKATAQ